MVHAFLEKLKRRVKVFRNIVPGNAWVVGFPKRHKEQWRVQPNFSTKLSLAHFSPEVMVQFFVPAFPPLPMMKKDNSRFR